MCLTQPLSLINTLKSLVPITILPSSIVDFLIQCHSISVHAFPDVDVYISYDTNVKYIHTYIYIYLVMSMQSDVDTNTGSTTEVTKRKEKTPTITLSR
jgi:hypothetical protein